MYSNRANLAAVDPEVFAAINDEAKREEDHLELIASENYVSPAVLAAQGSLLTNKYAEGYPGKRYYGGCEHVDIIENLAVNRAKELFHAAYANVQPHSGSQANAAAYLTCAKGVLISAVKNIFRGDFFAGRQERPVNIGHEHFYHNQHFLFAFKSCADYNKHSRKKKCHVTNCIAKKNFYVRICLKRSWLDEKFDNNRCRGICPRNLLARAKIFGLWRRVADKRFS